MNQIAVGYLTGAICFAGLYPIVYFAIKEVLKTKLNYPIMTGMFFIIFWPFFLTAITVYVIRDLKYRN